MRRFQQPKDTNKEISSVPLSKSVSVPKLKKRKRKKVTSKEKNTEHTEQENENDSDGWDFDDMYDLIKTRRAESESGPNLNVNVNVNVDSSEYNLRSKNPPRLGVDENAANPNTNTNKKSKRLQQPPVLVQVNLSKIKMESDYIPIIAIKKELNDSRVGNCDSAHESGAPLKRLRNLINSLPISPEKTQNSDDDEIGPTNKQQEERENVETRAALSENETERKKKKNNKKEEESNIIAKLEERIKNYSKRVMYLCTEKREMQDKLNQHQTEIQDLNSTVTLQRDENNQLKFQVAEQQTEIDNLKSKLKSIDEKTLIQTQDLQQSVDSLKSNTEQIPNAVQIIDLPTEVLSRVFEYLDMNSLKKSRFVSFQWREEAGKVLLKTFYLVCDDKERCENALQNWINNDNSDSDSSEKSLAQKLLSKDAQRTLQLLQNIPRLRNSVTELNYVQPDTENLYKILQLLPNLQVLETKTLDLNPQQKWLSLNSGNTNQNPNKLELLIQKLQRVNKLKLNFRMRKEASRNFLHQHFSSVKNLEIHAAGMSFISQFNLNSNEGQNFTITRFTLDLHKNYDVQMIRSFIFRISPGLQHLKLIVAKNTFNSSKSSSSSSLGVNSNSNLNVDVEPWKDDWMIPIGLTSIKSVEIVLIPQEISAPLQKFMLKSIIISLTLPQLKKLAVGFIPKKLEETIHKWNRNWNAQNSLGGRKLKSESLEELEIFPHFPKLSTPAPSSSYLTTNITNSFQYNHKKIPGHPWPQLKSLKCSWNSQESFDASFLSELKNLERLELSIWKWSPDENTMKVVETNRYKRTFALDQQFEK